MAVRERLRPLPVPLDEVPEVAEFLTRLGLGNLGPDDVSAFFGRNDTWAGVTDAGVPVFVKRISGEADLVRRRVRRTRAMGELLDAHAVITTPRFLGDDGESGLVALALLDEARNGAHLASEDDFTSELARLAGVQVGTLHTLPAPEPVAEDTSEPPLPPLGRLSALPLEFYAAASGGELEAWGILHDDPAVAEAITRLCRWEGRASRVLVHGDLRLDQFLYHDGTLHLGDWEEVRLADPARDVGAFAGEWLYRAVVLGMAGHEDVVGEREVVAGGVQRFEALRPHIEAFWSGYLEARPAARADEELATRSAAFAGWHMFDRVIAAGIERSRLTALERAAAGVGRRVLTAPAEFTTTLGFGGAR
ncbi:class V lanthionine synthetase subunit LxmK [Sphaerisporangium fuscum]|uniref:class V lanthionine synthetase subunit LxmK n=1 Tax=Sphaerisporangium fuscum TaxID=2835868 RepID=UPI001BDBD0F1|nr:class V lanthionine synthetase subunit LxmK [Sphaerisporangium fuscum]